MAEYRTYRPLKNKCLNQILLTGLLIIFSHSVAFSQSIKEFDDDMYRTLQESVDYNETPQLDKSQGLELDLDFNIPPALAKLFMYLFIPIILISLFLIIRNQTQYLSGQQKQLVNIRRISEDPEDLAELDLEKMLNDAMHANDHRVALRILYLQAIQLLTQKKMIEWRIDKTNRQYINELHSFPGARTEFAALTKIYEKHWYGEQNLASSLFDDIRSRFNKFRSQTFSQTI